MADSKESEVVKKIMKNWPVAPIPQPWERIVEGLGKDTNGNIIACTPRIKNNILTRGTIVNITIDRVVQEYDSLDEKALEEEKKMFKVFGGDIIAYKMPQHFAVLLMGGCVDEIRKVLTSPATFGQISPKFAQSSEGSQKDINAALAKVHRIAAVAAKLPLNEIGCLFLDGADSEEKPDMMVYTC